MTVDRQQDGAFQHPDKAAVRDKMDRSGQLRAQTLGRGASVFIGYIRSHARPRAEVSKDQEAWQQGVPPTAA